MLSQCYHCLDYVHRLCFLMEVRWLKWTVGIQSAGHRHGRQGFASGFPCVVGWLLECLSFIKWGNWPQLNHNSNRNYHSIKINMHAWHIHLRTHTLKDKAMHADTRRNAHWCTYTCSHTHTSTFAYQWVRSVGLYSFSNSEHMYKPTQHTHTHTQINKYTHTHTLFWKCF